MHSHRCRFVYSFSLFQLYANVFLPLLLHPSLFRPIRMTFPLRLWPAPACPWKSCALWRVRVRVQRSLHPQRSSTESMTWVRLPDLHLATRKFRPLLPVGNTLGRWSRWMHFKCIVMEITLLCEGMCTKSYLMISFFSLQITSLIMCRKQSRAENSYADYIK